MPGPPVRRNPGDSEAVKSLPLTHLARVASLPMADQSTACSAATRGRQALFQGALAAFFPRDAAGATIEPAPGGFSGSPVAKVVLPSGACWAVKGLPQGVDAPRARWGHRLMRHLRETPLPFVAEVAEVTPGVTLWQDSQGRLWEMLAWMPGSPRLQPREAERTAGLQAVAAVHLAAGRFPAAPATMGPPASLTERVQQCRQLLQRGWLHEGHVRVVGRKPVVERERLALERIDRAFMAAAARLASDGGHALRRVAAWQPGPTSLLAAVRDLSADHLLFADGDARDESLLPRVTGLIDFHAARLDSPACDLARLVGSWHGGLPDAAAIENAVVCYAESLVQCGGAPASVRELCRLVELLTTTGVILGLDNWIRWLAIEERQFPDWDAVALRVERLAAAVGPAFRRLAAAPLQPSFRR